MDIKISNYYYSAIKGFGNYQKAKRTIYTYVLPHEQGIKVLSSYVNRRLLFPAVSWTYQTIGKLTERAVSMISTNWGQRIKFGWTDPLSSKTLFNIAKRLQLITEPIAFCKPLNYPILSSITQSLIGLARLCDITLKDLSALFELPTRVTEIFLKYPWKAFSAKSRTLTGKAGGIIASNFYLLFWILIKIGDMAIRIFQAISDKLGYRLGDEALMNLEEQERAINSYFEKKIHQKGVEVRKKFFRLTASAITQNAFSFTSETFRYLMVKGIVLILLKNMDSWGYFQSSKQLKFRNSVQEILERMTFKTVAALNLASKIYSYGVFLKEFSKNVEGDYVAKDHTLFYKNTLINSFFKVFSMMKTYRNRAIL